MRRRARDYLFSYALHWNELRSMGGNIEDYATSSNDPRMRDIAAQTQRLVKLLEKDFSALVRAITKTYIRRPTEASPTAPAVAPQLELRLDSMKRWNSIPASLDARAASVPHFGPRAPAPRAARSPEDSPDLLSRTISIEAPVLSDLRVEAQVFTDSVELARLDESCFMRDIAYSIREQELTELWKREFPSRPLVEPGQERRMKPLIRRGVPHALRKDVWAVTTGAAQLLADRPNLYRHAICDTFPSVQGIIDSSAANLVNKMHGVDPIKVPLFGGKLPHHFPLNDHGMHQTRILLCVVAQNTHVEHCPMLPIVVAALLMYLPEPRVYAAARCLLRDQSSGGGGGGGGKPTPTEKDDSLTYRHLPTTLTQSRLATKMLGGLLKKKLPTLAKHLDKVGADWEAHARLWFDTLFSDVLSISHMLDVLDVFFLEGSKILQRVGLALFKTCEKELLKTHSKEEVDDVLHTKLRQMPEVQNIMRTSFSFQLKRKEMDELERTLRASVKVDLLSGSFRDGLYFRPAIQTRSKVVTKEEHWEHLFYWLADHPGVAAAPWRMVFSTWRDGFSLKTLYTNCGAASPSILLVKALPHQESEHGSWNWGMEVFGVFCTDPLKVTNQYYGSGNCFVFRLTPHPTRWMWTGIQATDGSPSTREPSSLCSDPSAEAEPPNTMFINGYTDRLVFGGGGDGPALELSGDLQTATTCASATYRNTPLCSASLFDLQHVEVYTFDT